MTEPELIQVLSGRFNVNPALLQDVSKPDFPKKLFEKRDGALAYELLIMIFEKGITAGFGLCDAEKAIVREIQSWPCIETNLRLISYMFLDSDLRTGPKFRYML